MKKPLNFLAASADLKLNHFYTSYFRDRNHHLHTVTDKDSAITHLADHPCEAIMIGDVVHNVQLIPFIEEIRRTYPRLRIVVCSSRPYNQGVKNMVREAGADDCIFSAATVAAILTSMKRKPLKGKEQKAQSPVA